MRRLHHQLVFKRRVHVLSKALSEALPQNARVLDIGCGSGDIALAIMARRPDVTIHGVDVLVRPDTPIDVQEFDGANIPHAKGSFDVSLLVDVLHHTDDPASLLAEASRVARAGVLIKDHYRDGFLAEPILRLMDWFGNASHGVRLPYNYLARKEWHAVWQRVKIVAEWVREDLGLYPMPFDLLFGRGLHFIAFLRESETLRSVS